MNLRLLAALPLLASFTASAHPGHGPMESSTSHWLTSLDHLLPAVGIVAVILAVALIWKRSTPLRSAARSKKTGSPR
jgi:hydrogenase/urease accessory protein HupE